MQNTILQLTKKSFLQLHNFLESYLPNEIVVKSEFDVRNTYILDRTDI